MGNGKENRWSLETGLAGLFLLFVIAFNLYNLYPEAAFSIPPVNDGILHQMAFERAASAIASGEDPTDHWFGPITMGYPLFHHYQHLPHVLLALVYYPVQNLLASTHFFNIAQVLLLSLFPLCTFWMMRRFGFSPLPAALSGLVSSLLATDGLYGLDFSSYVWRGYGMYTQLWGMLLAPLALGQGYRTVRSGKGYFWTVLLLAALMLSHLVYVYITGLSLAAIALSMDLPQAGRSRVLAVRLGRILLVFLLTGVVTAYFLLPFGLDRAYMNRSVWEYASKYDSYGHEWVLNNLAHGQLFDGGRFPSVTILVLAGLLLCLWQRRNEAYRIPVILFGLWLLLYFGRPTWGVLLDLLPLSSEMHFHRLIGGVHLAGICLAGVALALPWQALLKRPDSLPRLAVALGLSAALLFPVLRERNIYLAGNTEMVARNQAALEQDGQDIYTLIETLRSLPPGRVYAGLPATWGKDFKVGDYPVYHLLNRAGLDMLGYLYHALSLNADIQVLFEETRFEHYNLFNVRYVVAPSGHAFPAFVQPLQDIGRFRLYRVDTSGYFDFVRSDLALQGDRSEFYSAASAWSGSPLPASKEHPAIYLSGTPPAGQPVQPLAQAASLLPALPASAAPPPGRVISEIVSPNAYQAQVETSETGLLMLKATYHPNLRVQVDGIPVQAMMLMPSFVGIPLPAGDTHQVKITYQPPAYKWLLVLAGILTLAAIAVLERKPSVLPLGPFKTAFNPRPARLGDAARRLSTRLRLSAIHTFFTQHLASLAILLGLALLAGLPLFQFKIIQGHDALEYLPRSILFYEALKGGDLAPRWIQDLSAGHGQPFFNFNPPVFYYLTSFFHAAGFSFVASQNMAAFAVIVLAGLGMYLLGNEIFGRRGGLIAAAAYIFAPYFLVNVYVRQALADFTGFAWLPYTFWGAYRFALRGGFLHLLAGSGALALLVLSSNPIALIAFPFLLLLPAWLAFRQRDWRIAGRALFCLGLGLGLSAYFWMPALAERDMVHLERLKEGYLNYRNHFVYPVQFIYSPAGYGLSYPGTEQDEMSFAIGPLYLLSCAAALLLLRRSRTRSANTALWMSFALILTFSAAFLASQPSAWFWDRLPLLQFLEFPWRFLSLAAFASAILVGALAWLVPIHDGRGANIALAALLIVILCFGLPLARVQGYFNVTDADYQAQNIATQDIAVNTAREYEPVWVQERPALPAPAPFTLLSGEARLLSRRLSPTATEAMAQVQGNSRLRANIFYFPGWTLQVDGAPRSYTYDNPQGLIEFDLEPGEHLVQLTFMDTPVRRRGEVVSILAVGILIFSGFRASRRKGSL